jgi:predicted NACHT family NTPase
MERSRKLTLTNWTKANDALNLRFEGNKSKLAEDRKMSRTTVTAFFKQEPVREAEFRKICFALNLNEQDWEASNQTDSWIEEVRSRCCEKVLHQHGKIQLLNQTAEVRVDELYVDVWLLNRSPRTFQVSGSTLLKSFDLRNDRLGMGDRIQRDEGMAVANNNSKLLILGKPGSGKTTFLKHLAVDCSNGKFQPDLIPVLIELRRVRSAEWRLLTAVAESLETDQLKTQELLEQGKLLILLDGLDEVPTSALRREVQAQVSELSQEPKYSNNRLILTCRTQIIEVIPLGFMSVEVADFNDEQVKAFVSNWFRASGQTESKIAQQWQAFSEEIQKNPALKELTVTPVLLSLICLVLQDTGELPSQTALLYRKGIRLLLEKWNDRKDIPEWEIGKEVYRHLSLEEKEALLTEIAVRKFENPSNFLLFEQTDLTRQIAQFLNLSNSRDGEAVLRAIEAQHGLLVERADELWSFSHLTFQEYFTAQWFSQLQQGEVLAEKMADKRWQGVIKLTVENQQPADRLLRLIKRAIDCCISRDAKLQELLIQVHTKTALIQTQHNLVAIRAFYFVLATGFDRDLALNFDLILARDLAHDLDHLPSSPYAVFDFNLDLVLEFDLIRALDRSRHLDLTTTRHLALDLALVIVLSLTCALVPNRALTIDLACKLAITMVPLMSGKLANLREQLLRYPTQTWNSFEQWWQSNGQDWEQELRQVMIEHRNIGHDWQFTEPQRQALLRYYDANKFLIELLKKPGAVSNPVRQEIEDNLLLPIATLQQRLPEHYS